MWRKSQFLVMFGLLGESEYVPVTKEMTWWTQQICSLYVTLTSPIGHLQCCLFLFQEN